MVKAVGRMRGSFEERAMTNIEKSIKKKRSAKKLTRKQVINLLYQLEQGWPEDLWIFVASGTLTLMKSASTKEERFTNPLDGAVDPQYIIEEFAGIDADGGDF